MAALYDIETLLGDLETHLKANLGTALTAINTEKNDGITCENIDSDAYYFQYLGKTLANKNLFLLYGIESMTSNGIGPGSVKTYTISVVIVHSDSGNDKNLVKRLLRYQRALTSVLETGWSAIRKSVNFRVSGLAPIPLDLLNSSRPDRAIGIEIQVDLG